MTPAFRVAAFLVPIFVGSGVNVAFLPLFLAARGLTPADIGAVLGIGALLRVLANPAWGYFADRSGSRRPVLISAALLATATSLALLASQGFFVLLLVTTATGIAAAPLMPLADVLSLALARERRLVYAPVRAVGSAAFMATNALTGFIIQAFGVVTVPIMLVASYAAVAALAGNLPEASSFERTAPREAGAVRLLHHRPFLLTLAASALIQSSHAAYYGLGAIHWRAHGVSDGAIGLLFAEGVAAEVAFFLFGRRIADRIGPAGLTGLAAAACLLRWTVLSQTTAIPALAAVQMLHAATYGMQHLSAMLMLSRTIPPEQAATAQTLHASMAIGAPTGVLLWATGAFYDGSGTVFLAMAALGGAGLLVAPALRPYARA